MADCTYPDCWCPFDHPGTPGWCARGLTTPTPPDELLPLPELSLQDLRDMGADGDALDAIWSAARIIGATYGTAHAACGELQKAATRFRHALAAHANCRPLREKVRALEGERDALLVQVIAWKKAASVVEAHRDSYRDENAKLWEALADMQRKALTAIMENAEHDAGEFDDEDEDAMWARHTYDGLRKLLATPSDEPKGNGNG